MSQETISQAARDDMTSPLASVLDASTPLERRMVENGDFRLDWLRDRLTKMMAVDDEKYAATLIEENRTELSAFLEDPIDGYADIGKQVLFFWRTWYDRVVEETVIELEEGALPEYDIVSNTTNLKKIISF